MYVSIRIKGYLDPALWQDYLDGLQIVHEPDGASRLCGTLPDQPALYGVLNKLAHLSLALLSLEASEPAENAGVKEDIHGAICETGPWICAHSLQRRIKKVIPCLSRYYQSANRCN